MKILLAGGGTAGHIEPALAVARAMQRKYPDAHIEFVGTSHGLENSLIPAAGFSLQHIPKVSIARKLSPTLLLVPLQLIRAVGLSIKLLRRVDCVIGFGGYVSAPIYLAAGLTRTPFVIHEQNAHPGWANRMGALFTSYKAISYPVANGALAKAELTGLPLREDVIRALASTKDNWEQARSSAKKSIADQFGFDSNQPLIFIFGGSQGSQAINAVIEKSRVEGAFDGISLIHGVGKNNVVPPKSDSYIAVAYIEEMAKLYLAADLIIARSGAVTCAEVSALGRYALFIPLPIGNGEQALNANSLVAADRAVVISQADFNSSWLKSNIASLLKKSAARPAMADSSGASAVDKIIELIERACGVK
jgi:UDP-N-acetylglucosamine--N-acetylmuramyl-(pentapeptide) pyrophosphoryl-undecaprenol N-acetylglucosamine transferase